MSEKVVQKQKVKGNTKSGAPAAASSSSSSSSTAQKARVGGVELDDRVKRILEVRKVVKERDQARADGDFGKSDILREQLAARYNVELIDQKGGPSGWKFKDGTSHKLPAGINLPEPVTGQKRSRDEPQSNGSNSAREGSGEKKKVKINPQQAPAAAKPKPAKPSAEQERNKALISNFVAPAGAERKVQGVTIEDLKIGTGDVKSKTGDRIKMHYVGKLKTNGKIFDSSVKKPFVFRLGRGEVIPGWDIGCQGMTVGGKRKLTIPPEKAYGKAGAPPTIPSNATLVFEVQLVEIM